MFTVRARCPLVTVAKTWSGQLSSVRRSVQTLRRRQTARLESITATSTATQRVRLKSVSATETTHFRSPFRKPCDYVCQVQRHGECGWANYRHRWPWTDNQCTSVQNLVQYQYNTVHWIDVTCGTRDSQRIVVRSESQLCSCANSAVAPRTAKSCAAACARRLLGYLRSRNLQPHSAVRTVGRIEKKGVRKWNYNIF